MDYSSERKSSVISNPGLLDVDPNQKHRSPSPDDANISCHGYIKPNYIQHDNHKSENNHVPNNIPTINVARHRGQSETSYAEQEVEELFSMLRESDSLEEQGDILQYLVDTKGPEFNTGMLENGKVVTVKDLLKGLYEKACQQKLWGLVRHSAGMLGKRVEDFAKAVTDLLVRQKQVSFAINAYILMLLLWNTN